MAHGYLQSFDNSLEVHSAGTEPAEQVNPWAVQVMKEAGIDISHHTPKLVDVYLNHVWDYVITVCDGANETCPAFIGKVKHRLHIGFEDPAHATGSEKYIYSEYIRTRDLIKDAFYSFYQKEIKPS
jgi:arsenate reductase